MKKKLVVVAGILLLFLGVLGIYNMRAVKAVCGNWFSEKEVLQTPKTWGDGKLYEHIVYADVSDSDYLHLYVPESDHPLPLYIMVHGGGFFLNDLESHQAMLFCQNIYEKGYAVATVNYRLGSEAKYPAAIEDVKAAVRFLRANAQQYGLDPNHFALAGESAGGYLACMAAVTTDDEFSGVPYIGENQNKAPVSASVQAVVDFYGATDFWTFKEEFAELGIPENVRNMANGWMTDVLKGTGMQTLEELWIGKSVSSMSEEEKDSCTVAHYVKKNLSPSSDLKTVILHGDADITVPYLQSAGFSELMEKQTGKDKVAYRLFPGYGHGADGFFSPDTIGWITEEIGWS